MPSQTLEALDKATTRKAEMVHPLLSALDHIAMSLEFGRTPRAELAAKVEQLSLAAHGYWMLSGDKSKAAFDAALAEIKKARGV